MEDNRCMEIQFKSLIKLFICQNSQILENINYCDLLNQYLCYSLFVNNFNEIKEIICLSKQLNLDDDDDLSDY